MDPAQLAPIDVRIIRALHENARSSMSKIASRLAMPESTVRHRLNRLVRLGIIEFAAIVNPPQAAILAVGRIADRVVAVDGQPTVRPTMIITLSCDHRAIDGARAAQFLDELIGLIEEPWGLLA